MIAAYSPYCEGFQTEEEGGWALLTAVRRQTGPGT